MNKILIYIIIGLNYCFSFAKEIDSVSFNNKLESAIKFIKIDSLFINFLEINSGRLIDFNVEDSSNCNYSILFKFPLMYKKDKKIYKYNFKEGYKKFEIKVNDCFQNKIRYPIPDKFKIENYNYKVFLFIVEDSIWHLQVMNPQFDYKEGIDSKNDIRNINKYKNEYILYFDDSNQIIYWFKWALDHGIDKYFEELKK